MAPTKVKVPKWAFDTSFAICKARAYRYRHQFKIRKMADIVKDDPQLAKDVEGVIGYIGDICACELLGIDPKERLRAMLVETDLLTHRDEYDLAYRGWRLDVKVEFYPEGKLGKILDRTIKKDETFGCHLINDTQFEENSKTVDVYVYSTLDSMDPRRARYWYPIGWIRSSRILTVCPKPLWYVPAGPKLHTPAYIVPNDELEPIETLSALPQKPKGQPQGRNEPSPEDLSRVDRERLSELRKKLGL